MRERLIELIAEAVKDQAAQTWEEVADYLLDNGVIVLHAQNIKNIVMNTTVKVVRNCIATAALNIIFIRLILLSSIGLYRWKIVLVIPYS